MRIDVVAEERALHFSRYRIIELISQAVSLFAVVVVIHFVIDAIREAQSGQRFKEIAVYVIVTRLKLDHHAAFSQRFVDERRVKHGDVIGIGHVAPSPKMLVRNEMYAARSDMLMRINEIATGERHLVPYVVIDLLMPCRTR